MRTFPDARMRHFLSQASFVAERLEVQDHEAALPAIRSLEARLGLVQVSSGWVSWALAVALDQSGDPVAAFAKIKEALEADPLNSSHHGSYDIIVGSLRGKLAGAPEGSSEAAQVYQLLLEAGECDVPAHLVWVRHLLHGNRLDEAAQLCEAVTLLAPADLEGWRTRARVARLRKDAHLAAECEAELAVRSADPVPLGLPRIPEHRS